MGNTDHTGYKLKFNKKPFIYLNKDYNKVRKVRKVRIMKEVFEQDRFIVSVKVGPKGQITIPKEAREMFDIKEGESLLVMGDKSRGGLAIMKADAFYALMEDKK